MIKRVWDWLFIRRKWEVVARYEILTRDNRQIGELFVMRDQFGNIKRKKVVV